MNSDELEFDVISICSPTIFHIEHLEKALKFKPRLIFLEKPISSSLEETVSAVEKCESLGIKLAINYTRRWAPDVIRLRKELVSEKWGEVRSVVCHYNKGLLNNGSHMIDLLKYLFGELQLVSVVDVIHDYWENDPTISAVLKTKENIYAYMNAANASDYEYFELQIICSRGLISMHDGGLNWSYRNIIKNPNFIGYRSLGSIKQYHGEYDMALPNAVDNIYQNLTNNVSLLCSGETAIETQKLCQTIRETALNKKLDNYE